jgi:predicted unusual protein kinase regulating ubiquinone biosynthesis (AarF/ABC1/UbiB family)
MKVRAEPGGRLGRLTRLAQFGARTGASFLFSRDGKGAADQAAEVLGSLRGLAAKVGQMASYVDGMVPDEHRDAYEKAMTGMRAAAPASSPQAIKRVVELELGKPIGELFASFDEAPLASASIGQVHRATLPDGREVAVKVQHPGIERAIESDLKNGSVLEGMLSMLGPRALNTKQMYEEVAERFREELDYQLEAERQQMFRRIHAGDPAIRIPQVIAERSSKRVLTTELVAGKSLDEAAQEDEALRAKYCEVLWRFVYKGNLVAGMFNADPHPGNYYFHDDGTITFLDFGCVQPIHEPRLAEARNLHAAARTHDDALFRRSTVAILHTRGGAYEEAALAYVRLCFAPLLDSPYRITREYATQVVRGIYAMKQHVLRGDGSFVGLPAGMVFMNRLQFGFYSVLARLDAEVDYAAVEERFLRDAGASARG